MRKRLLIIAPRVPYPPDKGERTRLFHEIRILARHFSITLAFLSRGRTDAQDAEHLRPWCQTILTVSAPRTALLHGLVSLISGRSVTEGFFSNPHFYKAIAAESRRVPFDLVLLYSSAVLPYAAAAGASPCLIDLVDADSAKWAAYAQIAHWPMRWVYHREAIAVAALEREALDRCAAAFVVSPAEVEALPPAKAKAVVARNGVDADFFSSGGAAPADLGPAGLVFTGSMNYKPNVMGVCWFVQNVWPSLHRQLPYATFSIVGRHPAPAVRRLARVPGVRVTGAVNDVRPFLAGASVVICPMQMSRGVLNKILEAMAMGKAVVASPCALQGIDATSGEHVHVAQTPAEWHDRILSLLSDPLARSAMASAAASHVREFCTWELGLEPLVGRCLQYACAE